MASFIAIREHPQKHFGTSIVIKVWLYLEV